MPTALNLDAYFARIGWREPAPPTLATLARLMRAHMLHIPFESLDTLLGRPVRLDLEALQEKLIGARRGGYCFEHATLFAAVMEELGFQPVSHLARVVVFAPPEKVPRLHMLLSVALEEGRFIVDPGFGGYAAPFPVPLIDQGASPPPGTTHWMMCDGRSWILRTLRDGAAIDGWISNMEPEYAVDFEVANHFTATHESSPFRNMIMMSILKDDGRLTVLNRDVTMRRGDKVLSSFQLADRAALRALIVEHLGFDLPEVEKLRIPAIPEWG